jgi:hypothetical protein
MVAVMAEAAICRSRAKRVRHPRHMHWRLLTRRLTGAMTFDLMLYLIPSLARVMVKAIRPARNKQGLPFTGRIVDLT